MDGNTSYATLASTTLSHFANDIFDNVITNNACLNMLKKAGNIKIVGGGREFTHPVYYQKNSTFGAISKYGTIPTDLQDPVTRAVYDIKVIAGSVVYSMVEEAMNAGSKEKLIDYVETLKMDAETSMSELLGDQLFTLESALGANDFDSIDFIISSDATVSTDNLGDLVASANSDFWVPYMASTTSFLTAGSSDGTTMMDTVVNNTTYGRQGPTFIITTAAMFTYYSRLLTANMRYTQANLAEGNAGFRNLMFSNLPVMIDSNCTTNTFYFIDGNALKLQVLSMGNMKITPMQPAYSQLMARALLYIFGNLTCGSRRTCGRLRVDG